mmetsp:Transcript_1980/g.5302  ORF Transcript_1980/g.5302 Transcript_1980/m.5302 type:complete len:476 (+) Transcript_1980:1053-2480(+)
MQRRRVVRVVPPPHLHEARIHQQIPRVVEQHLRPLMHKVGVPRHLCDHIRSQREPPVRRHHAVVLRRERGVPHLGATKRGARHVRPPLDADVSVVHGGVEGRQRRQRAPKTVAGEEHRAATEGLALVQLHQSAHQLAAQPLVHARKAGMHLGLAKVHELRGQGPQHLSALVDVVVHGAPRRRGRRLGRARLPGPVSGFGSGRSGPIGAGLRAFVHHGNAHGPATPAVALALLVRMHGDRLKIAKLVLPTDARDVDVGNPVAHASRPREGDHYAVEPRHDNDVAVQLPVKEIAVDVVAPRAHLVWVHEEPHVGVVDGLCRGHTARGAARRPVFSRGHRGRRRQRAREPRTHANKVVPVVDQVLRQTAVLHRVRVLGGNHALGLLHDVDVLVFIPQHVREPGHVEHHHLRLHHKDVLRNHEPRHRVRAVLSPFAVAVQKKGGRGGVVAGCRCGGRGHRGELRARDRRHLRCRGVVDV